MAKQAHAQVKGQGRDKPRPRQGQGHPPNKKARVDTEVEPTQAKAKKPLKSALKNPSGKSRVVEDVDVDVDLKSKSTSKSKSSARSNTKPKFSMRLKGSPGPGSGAGRDKGKGKAKAKVEEEEDDVEEEDDGDDDENDDDEEVDVDVDVDDSDDDDDGPSPTIKPPKPTKPIKPRVLPTSFKIIAGSYEKLLYGLKGTVSVSPSSPSTPTSTTYLYTYTLSPIFIFPAHVGCIKAVAASPEGGKWLATGSADEIIKVWDLRRRKEIGGLMHHEGSITHLTFPSRSHLLSASEDGTLCLFRARDWSVLRALRGHKGPVNTVAVHPSGKVALSAGRDATLRMWDLMRGKGVASMKLGKGKEGEIVRWSSDGELFAVQSGSTIDIYSTSMDLIHTITHPSRVQDVRFTPRVDTDGELLLVGAEDKLLSVYEVSSDTERKPKVVAVMTGHSRRVKAIQTIEIALPPLPSLPTQAPTRQSTTLVCTVSSDGYIHVYDLAMVPSPSYSSSSQNDTSKKEIEPVAKYDSNGTRLTCVALADGDVEAAMNINVDVGKAGKVVKAGEKRKEPEGEDEGGSDGESGEWPSEEGEEEGEEEEEAEMESD